MNDFQYDYVKPKYNVKAKLYYMDRDSLIDNVNTEDIYEDIAKDVEKKSDQIMIQKDRFQKEKQKSHQFNERWIKQKNNEIICGINSKNIQLFNRWKP